MPKIENPREGGDVNRLWRIVSEVVDVVNALTSAKVHVEKLGPEQAGSGRIILAQGNSALHLRLPQGGGGELPEVGSPDTSKTYALVAIYNSGTGKPNVPLQPSGWAAEWQEVCAIV
jgi:hypothetical protein